VEKTEITTTEVAKPGKVAIIGASGTYGKGVLARAEEIGVEVVVIILNAVPCSGRSALNCR